MELLFTSKLEEYYEKFVELQEKLKRSEEQRFLLEMKFNDMVQIAKEEEQAHYKKLRAQYKRFLEEDHKRHDRNERIIRHLERIETRISMLTAKTERVNMLRRQYQNFLVRITQKKEPACRVQHDPEKTKFSDYEPAKREEEDKMEILDRYLQTVSTQKCRDSVGRASSSSNRATAIADDIMNSIYSRYYSKEPDLGRKLDNEKSEESGNKLDKTEAVEDEPRKKEEEEESTFVMEPKEAIVHRSANIESVITRNQKNEDEEEDVGHQSPEAKPVVLENKNEEVGESNEEEEREQVVVAHQSPKNEPVTKNQKKEKEEEAVAVVGEEVVTKASDPDQQTIQQKDEEEKVATQKAPQNEQTINQPPQGETVQNQQQHETVAQQQPHEEPQYQQQLVHQDYQPQQYLDQSNWVDQYGYQQPPTAYHQQSPQQTYSPYQYVQQSPQHTRIRQNFRKFVRHVVQNQRQTAVALSQIQQQQPQVYQQVALSRQGSQEVVYQVSPKLTRHGSQEMAYQAVTPQMTRQGSQEMAQSNQSTVVYQSPQLIPQGSQEMAYQVSTPQMTRQGSQEMASYQSREMAYPVADDQSAVVYQSPQLTPQGSQEMAYQPQEVLYSQDPLQQYDELPGYDEYGQMIFYDQHGQAVQPHYDENGHIVPQYDQNGQVVMIYDHNGQALMMGEHHQGYQDYEHQGYYEQGGEIVQEVEEGIKEVVGVGEVDEVEGKRDEEISEVGAKEEKFDDEKKEEEEDDKVGNVMDILDTDTELSSNVKQNTSSSNDFDFS